MIVISNEKINIKLESFDNELLIISCQKIINNIKTNQSNLIKLISLPTKKRIYCVLRSPHVNKDSREHFEIRRYKRVLEIYCKKNLNILDVLAECELPSGVYYRVCIG